jgi:hypothetical protein
MLPPAPCLFLVFLCISSPLLCLTLPFPLLLLLLPPLARRALL